MFRLSHDAALLLIAVVREKAKAMANTLAQTQQHTLAAADDDVNDEVRRTSLPV